MAGLVRLEILGVNLMRIMAIVSLILHAGLGIPFVLAGCSPGEEPEKTLELREEIGRQSAETHRYLQNVIQDQGAGLEKRLDEAIQRQDEVVERNAKTLGRLLASHLKSKKDVDRVREELQRYKAKLAKAESERETAQKQARAVMEALAAKDRTLWKLVDQLQKARKEAGIATSVAGDAETHGTTASLGQDLAIYLGCGVGRQPGVVTQLDAAGNVLGTVKLPGRPCDLSLHQGGLVAAVPITGQILRIDSRGNVQTLLGDQGSAIHPLAIAVAPASGDILVADNKSDVLTFLPAANTNKPRELVQIQGYQDILQGVSIALTKDAHVLLGCDNPDALYRFRLEENCRLGRPFLSDYGAVAANPSSDLWVAALRRKLNVYEGSQRRFSLTFPPGKTCWNRTVAFGPNGVLVVALYRGDLYSSGVSFFDVFRVDLERKTFHPLFSRKSVVVCLAVAPRMAWLAQSSR